MKDWKVTLLNNGKTLELVVQAQSYSDAYIKTELLYPDCMIKSIKPLGE
jgi:hypothetical protein